MLCPADRAASFLMGKNVTEFPTEKGHFRQIFLTDCLDWGTCDMFTPMTNLPSGELSSRTPIDVDALSAEQRAELGPLIKSRREARGLSQQDVAEAAGIDRKTYGTLESGRRAPHASKLRAVLEALGVPQVGDADRHYSERTRSFVVTTAPIFDQLPDDMKDEAQHDVVVLLAGKLSRANGDAGITSIRRVGGSPQDEVAPTSLPTAAKRGKRKADNVPHAD